MARTTIIFALLLIVLGVVGYVGTTADTSSPESAGQDAALGSNSGQSSEAPKRSITALIPAFAGGLLLVFGVIALNEKMRMHAMHAAVLIALLGFIAAGGRAVMGMIKLMSADAQVNGRSLFFVSMMAVLCAIYVALSVRSFIQARRRQEGEALTA